MGVELADDEEEAEFQLSDVRDAELRDVGRVLFDFETSRFQLARPAVLLSVLLQSIRTPPVRVASLWISLPVTRLSSSLRKDSAMEALVLSNSLFLARSSLFEAASEAFVGLFFVGLALRLFAGEALGEFWLGVPASSSSEYMPNFASPRLAGVFFGE